MRNRLRPWKRLVLTAGLWGICSFGAVGQPADSAQSDGTPALAPTSDVAPAQSGGDTQINETPNGKQSSATSKDRLFFTLPNFLTLENAGEVPPMTVRQKYGTAIRTAFDPVEFFWYGALSGLSQWENSEPGYGQGAVGYGKRYGAYFADGTIENVMTSAVLPSFLHQDPRYFQMGKGGFWHRTLYAMSRIVITRTDSGNRQFNYSEVLGSAISAGISTYSYHPRGDRNIPNTVSVWGTQVGYDTLTLVVKEFWPDIRRRLHHTKTPPTAPASSGLAPSN
jgi:hypothetical protein